MQVKVSESFPPMPVVEVAVGSMQMKIISSLHTKSLSTIPTSNRVFSAIILWKPIPTPSMTANRQAHAIAEFRAAFIPPRTASAPPVKNPAMTVMDSKSAYILLTWCSTVYSVGASSNQTY
jgi:hypothetical protein